MKTGGESLEESGLEESGLREIGRLGKPHGVRGEVKVIPLSDDVDRFLGIRTVLIGRDAKGAKAYSVSSIRPHVSKKGLAILLSVNEIQDRDVIDSFRGQTLFAQVSELPHGAEHEVLNTDITGYTAINEEGDELGTVAEIIDRPPQNLLVLTTREKGDVMIPFVSEFVKSVDAERRMIVVSVIEGML